MKHNCWPRDSGDPFSERIHHTHCSDELDLALHVDKLHKILLLKYFKKKVLRDEINIQHKSMFKYLLAIIIPHLLKLFYY